MRHIRRGTTLIEQLVVIAILAIVTAIAITTAVRQLDAAAVHAASREVADAFAAARDHAMASGRRTAVRVRARDTVLLVYADDDLLEHRRLGLTYGVSVTGTRDSMAYAPTGLGWGAANLSVRIARGRAADTVTVSRLGRVSR